MTQRMPLQFWVASAARCLPEAVPGRHRLFRFAQELDPSEREVEFTAFRGLRFRGSQRVLGPYATHFWTPPALAPIFDASLRPGSVVADVGGFLGLYALWAARRVAPGGQVFCFEPLESSCGIIRQHVALNGCEEIVEVVNAAVGRSPGEVELHLAEGSHTQGITSRYLVRARSAGTLKVPSITLDGFFESRRPPALVKVDVEGMEPEVFEGAVRLLASDEAPVVVFEAERERLELSERSYPELIHWFSERGYSLWSLGPRGVEREPREARAPSSMNILGLREGLAQHRSTLERLRHTHFRRNQNV